MKYGERKNGILISFLLMGTLMFSISSAQGESSWAPTNVVDDAGSALALKFADAVKVGECDTAIELCEKLYSNFSESLVLTEVDRYTSVRNFCLEGINKLGEKGIAAFRISFDERANQLATVYREGDVNAGVELVTYYPFCSPVPEVLSLLVADFADMGQYRNCYLSFNQLLAQNPQTITRNGKILSVFAYATRAKGWEAEIESLCNSIKQHGWEDTKVEGIPILEYLASPQPVRLLGSGDAAQPDGFVRSTKVPESIANPVLVWKTSLAASSSSISTSESFVPIDRGDNAILMPKMLGNELYTLHGTTVQCLDVETGNIVKSYTAHSGLRSERYESHRAPHAFSVMNEELYVFGELWRGFSRYGLDGSLGRGLSLSHNAEVFSDCNVTPRARKAMLEANINAVSVAFDGSLFLGFSSLRDHNLIVLSSQSTSTGKVEWAKDVLAVEENRSSFSVLYDRSFYPSYSEGNLYYSLPIATACLSSTTGEVRWLKLKRISNKVTERNIGVIPPLVFPKHNLLIDFPLMDDNIFAFDSRTGEIRWQKEFMGDYLGCIGNSLYFNTVSSLVEIDLLTGKTLREEAVEIIVSGQGSLSSKYIYLPRRNGFAVFTLDTFRMVWDVDLPSGHHRITRVQLFKDIILCSTKDMLYCYRELEPFENAIKKQIETEPDNFLPSFNYARYLYYKGEYSAALEILKSVIEKLDDNDGAKYLVSRAQIADLLIECILSIQSELFEQQVTFCLELLQEFKGDTYLNVVDILLAKYLDHGRFESALDLLVNTLGSVEVTGSVSSHLGSRRFIQMFDYPDPQYVSRFSVYRDIAQVLFAEKVETEKFEQMVVEKKEEVAAEYLPAMRHVLSGLFFTKASKVIASEIAVQVLGGDDSEKLSQALEYCGYYTINDCPEVTLARHYVVREKYPALFEQLARDIYEHYQNRRPLSSRSDKTFAQIIPLLADIQVQRYDYADFSGGVVPLWQVKKVSKTKSKMWGAMNSAGNLVYSSGASLVCVNPLTGERLWRQGLNQVFSFSAKFFENSEGAVCVKRVFAYKGRRNQLKVLDVITHVNGMKFEGMLKFLELLDSQDCGSTMTLTVGRAGESREVHYDLPAEEYTNVYRSGIVKLSDSTIGIMISDPRIYGSIFNEVNINDGSMIQSIMLPGFRKYGEIADGKQILSINQPDLEDRGVEGDYVVFEPQTNQSIRCWRASSPEVTFETISTGTIAVETHNHQLYVDEILTGRRIGSATGIIGRGWQENRIRPSSRYLACRDNLDSTDIFDLHTLKKKNLKDFKTLYFFGKYGLLEHILSRECFLMDVSTMEKIEGFRLFSNRNNSDVKAIKVGANYLLCHYSQGIVLMLNPQTGKVIWSRGVKGGIEKVNLLGNNWVLVKTKEHRYHHVFIFNPETSQCVFYDNYEQSTVNEPFRTYCVLGNFVLAGTESSITLYSTNRTTDNLLPTCTEASTGYNKLRNVVFQLINAREFERAREVLNAVEGSQECSSARVSELRQLVAQFEEPVKEEIQLPNISKPFSSDYSKWGNEGWREFKLVSSNPVPSKLDEQIGDVDIFVSYKCAMSPQGLSVAIMIRARDISEALENKFIPRVYINADTPSCRSSFTGCELVMAYGNAGKVFSYRPKPGYMLNGDTFDSHFNLSGTEVELKHSTQYFEVLIDKKLLAEYVSAGLTREDSPSFRFNIILQHIVESTNGRGRSIRNPGGIYGDRTNIGFRIDQAFYPILRINPELLK